jgi:general transcription factor 3C polypeptide 5 (transcription factor C subunit 1)
MPTTGDHFPSQSYQDVHMHDGQAPSPLEGDLPPEPTLCSHSRIDINLWRRLRDNAENYTCEAVGEIKQTHRFRGMYSVGPILSSC